MEKNINKICTELNCNNKLHCKGLCKKHYERVQRHGDTSIKRRENNIGTLEEVFNRYANKKNNNECWLWAGGRFSQGYGRLVHDKKDLKAHRVSYELHKGIIPKGMYVCHSCDIPECVNPEHLWLGTHLENEIDKDIKKRRPKCEKAGRSKLTNNEVKNIKQKLASGCKQVSLVKEYNVSKSTISRIALNITWGEV